MRMAPTGAAVSGPHLSRFSAVVLAGERPGGSALSRELGLKAGVLVNVAGKPSLQRVIEALQAAEWVDGGVVCGPTAEIYRELEDFRNILEHSDFHWLAPAAGPSASAIKAVQSLGRYPVLLTTGDHALLTAELVDGFCRQAATADGDIVAGLAPWPIVHAAFPESRRTVQRYRGEAYCGTNLFAVLNPAGLGALQVWQEVETLRKQPWKIALKVGVWFMLRYLFRRVSLREAFSRLSEISACRAACVMVNDPRSAVDVDSVADRDLAERILRQG